MIFNEQLLNIAYDGNIDLIIVENAASKNKEKKIESLVTSNRNNEKTFQ